jgi:hypothetical protein
MRDPRTLANTTPKEIAEIIDREADRKAKKWKKPTMCAAPECKTMFTPSREWQKFCSPGCKNATHFIETERRKTTVYAELLSATRQIEELEAEVAQLKDQLRKANENSAT